MTRPRNPTTFAAATRQFLADADWLDASHAPAVISLRQLAAALDRELTAPLVAQYNLAYRNLSKQRPIDPDGDDPLEKALREAGQ